MLKDLVIATIYFFLPAYFANMCPVLFSKVTILGKPISARLFGAHKTWRGFLFGYFGAFIILLIQMLLAKQGLYFGGTYLDYTQINPFFYAFLFGIGALSGDLLKSFFKRRIGIESGRPWPIFDQVDFIIGVYAFGWLLGIVPINIFYTALIITPILHLLTNITAYKLGIKKVWW